MTKLKGKVALIIGAGSPLGSAAAMLLAKEGAWVGVNDWSPTAAEKVVAAITAEGGAAQSYPGDASKKLAFQTALEHMLEERGKVDLLINAASVQPQASLLEMDEWDWRRALDLNFSAVFLTMQTVARVMREQGGGTMVNLLSAEGEEGTIAYLSASAAVEAFSRAAAEEFVEHNIQVHSLRTSSSPESIRKALLPLLSLETVRPD